VSEFRFCTFGAGYGGGRYGSMYGGMGGMGMGGTMGPGGMGMGPNGEGMSPWQRSLETFTRLSGKQAVHAWMNAWVACMKCVRMSNTLALGDCGLIHERENNTCVCMCL
jgi:hypothetical protein